MDNRYPDFMQEPMYGNMVPWRQRPVELAQASVPYQYYTVSFPPMEALEKGTMFPELYRPYALRPYEVNR